MKNKPVLLLILALCFVSVAAYFTLNGISARSSSPKPSAGFQAENDMTSAALGLLASLSEPQKKAMIFDFEEEERQNFNFVPMKRKGLIFKEMNEDQRRLCLQLVQTGLSETGYQKATGIMEAEDILSDVEGRSRGNDYRNPEHYYLAIFGDPALAKPWGWRFEGHHLSLNYTSADGKLAVTPNFMGANPATWPAGGNLGRRLLAAEEDLGRHLVRSLDESQRRLAIISGKAFPEIISGNQRVVDIGKKTGIPYAALQEEQQELLENVIQAYLTRMKPEIAGAKWAAIRQEGLENVSFSWAGSLRPGEGHYYRIHGKSFLIEYDNTQNDANHVHTVWREFNGDFGRDLLQEHYRHSHKH